MKNLIIPYIDDDICRVRSKSPLIYFKQCAQERRISPLLHLSRFILMYTPLWIYLIDSDAASSYRFEKRLNIWQFDISFTFFIYFKIFEFSAQRKPCTNKMLGNRKGMICNWYSIYQWNIFSLLRRSTIDLFYFQIEIFDQKIQSFFIR